MIGWPEGIYLALTFLTTCFVASNNGKPRTGTHDFGLYLFVQGCVLALLWWGGFFA